MKLLSLLQPDFIRVDLHVTSKEEALREIIEAFHQKYHFKQSKEAVLQALYDREALGGTLLETGLALPHARFEGFNDVLVGICRPSKPIKTSEGEIRFMVVLLTAKSSSNLYLQTIAAFARISQNQELFHEICSTTSKKKLLQLIGSVEVKKDLLVEDIMTADVITASPDATIRQVADLFYKNDISYVPVINSQNECIGEITMQEILGLGIPDYAVKIGNLGFLATFEPFEYLLNNEETIQVKEIMKRPLHVVEAKSSVVEAALIMTKYKRRHLPVLQGSRLIGVISFMDILNKVIRG